MPRRNRQKLHRELRLRAESRKQERARARADRRAAAEKTRRIVREILRGSTRAPGITRAQAAEHVLIRGLDELMVLAHVSASVRRRVHRLAATVHREIPASARIDELGWMLLLARQPWVRAPEGWRAPSGSPRRKRDALALHLLARFPVPPFLVRALDLEPLAVARVPVEDEWAVGLLSHVGRGLSLFRAVGTDLLPPPLTRRMCHLFLGATAEVRPVRALRHAQVLGFGGPPELAQELLRTRLGELRGPDLEVGEPFWHGVIGWLCRRTDLDLSGLEQVLGWMEAMHRRALAEGRAFSLKGRTGASVRRDAAHHAHRSALDGEAFPACGLVAWEEAGWRLVELDSPAALADEGISMRHCAGEYVKLVRRGKASLWSLQRRDGEGWTRQATVEVALGAGALVQARRALNRLCSTEELAVLTRWAQANRLRISRRAFG